MRRAMADAEVGDDGYGEDPTVRRLEEAFAARVGKDASLFVPSGVMGNQLAVRVLAQAGTSVVVGRRQHLVAYCNGATGVNCPVQLHLVDDADGMVSASDVAWARRAGEHHQVKPSLVCLENTHMAAGGVPWGSDALAELAEAAEGLPVHMDGARLFNSEAATGVPASTQARFATTVMCCLSKGLCAPVGSLLAGPAEVIAEARQERARMGGTMRQAGVVAAAGLVALETMVERLAEDHRRARVLAEAVAERWPGAGLDPASVATNLVVFAHPDPPALLSHLRSSGVLGGTIAPGTVRLVTHRDVDDPGVERACRALLSAP